MPQMETAATNTETELKDPIEIKVLSAVHTMPDKPIYRDNEQVVWPDEVYEYLEGYKPNILALDSSNPDEAETQRRSVPIKPGNEVEIISADPLFTVKDDDISNALLLRDSGNDIIQDINLDLDKVVAEARMAIKNIDTFLLQISALSLVQINQKRTNEKLTRRDFLKGLLLVGSASTLALWKRTGSHNPEETTEVFSKRLGWSVSNKLLRLRNIKVWLSTYDYAQYKTKSTQQSVKAAVIWGTGHALDQEANINNPNFDKEKYSEGVTNEIFEYIDTFLEIANQQIITNKSLDINEFENAVYFYLLKNFAMYTVSQLNRDGSFTVDSLNGQGRRTIPSIQEYIHHKMFPNAVGDNIPTLEKRRS